ncbi:hypothetical protein KJ641_00310, partial [Patescibacteria group bacterium]|nr:hypothetical protein [Patescibacteria group bacterium]MBU1895301.1 hypothetical protein [Patescibacteria group bacterium]
DWQAEDSQSLLEGAPVELQREATVMAPELTLADLESKVLKKLNFSVASDLRGRVLSLITSRMKNIRTDEQFMDYAGREAEIGGLGLDESQTKELLDTAKKELSIPDMVRMGSRRQMRQEMAEKKNAPIVEPAPQKAPEEPRKPEVRRPIPIMPPAEPKIRMIEKPILHDVVLPHTNLDNDMSLGDSEHDLTTGPVDEIRDFSIIDFRRLASSPVKARELLLNKFRMLKKESYLYLIKAKIAWKDSPMYKGYLQVLAQALSDQKTIEQVLTSMESEESLTKEEFDSVVFVNSHIV